MKMTHRRRKLHLLIPASILLAVPAWASTPAATAAAGGAPWPWTPSPPPLSAGGGDISTADGDEDDHWRGNDDPHPHSLLDAALDRLLANVVTEEVTPRPRPQPHSSAEAAAAGAASDGVLPSEDDGGTAEQLNASSSSSLERFTYVSPCSPSTPGGGGARYVQESTSSLLAARALAKSGRSGLAWSILDSLFSVQGVNGFVPRYRFSSHLLPSDNNHTVGNDDDDEGVVIEEDGYVPGSYYPNSTLFGSIPVDYAPPSDSVAALGGVRGSGRISASPLHATVALEIFYLSGQTDYDLAKMEENFVRLTRWHAFLHDSGVGSVPPDDGVVLDPSFETKYFSDDLTGATAGGEAETEAEGGGGDDDDGILGGWSRHHSREPDVPLPLYNIIHPWESEIALDSPLWRSVLRPVVARMNEEGGGWQPAGPTPERVKRRSDYPGDEVYDAMLYLLECISNATNYTAAATTAAMDSLPRPPSHPHSSRDDATEESDDDYQPLTGYSTRSYESDITSQCRFAMLDVGYASALAKADGDMLGMAQILRDKNSKYAPSRADSVRLARWAERSSATLRGLWDDGEMMYVPRLVAVAARKNESGNDATDSDDDDRILDVMSGDDDDHDDGGGGGRHRVGYRTVPVDVPVADDFVALFGGAISEQLSRVDSVTFHLLQREGRYAFNCGRYPVWTVGGCGGNGNGTGNGGGGVVSPALNYFISRGLDQNGGSPLGHYLRNSTLNLVCGLPNTEGGGRGALYNNLTDGACPSFRNSTNILPFARYYDGRTGHPIGVGGGTDGRGDDDGCDGTTFTLTAAVIYDAMIPDKEFTYTFAPPISNVWVLVLITCELSVAFGIGVSCIVLSLNLMRRLKADDDGDVFVRLIRDQRVDLMDLYGDGGVGGLGGGGGSSMSMEDGGGGGGGLMYGSASSSLGGGGVGGGSSDADHGSAVDGSSSGEGIGSSPAEGCPSQRDAAEVMGFWDYARPYRENLNPFRLFASAGTGSGAAGPHPPSSAE